MKQPKVSIIISTFNQKKLLIKCLKSLQEKTNYKNYKIFLIDDSGKENVGKEIKKKYKNIKVIINKKNLGFSKSNNLGIIISKKEYNPDYFLLLNDDTEIIQKNWLKNMVEYGKKDKETGILGCKIIYPNGKLQWFGRENKIQVFKRNKETNNAKKYSNIKYVQDIIGACFLIKKEVIEKIGFLDEKFSPVYGEESDFCQRALKKGFKLSYIGTSKIIHYGGASTKTLFNKHIWFLKKRNAIRLEWLNFNILNILKYSLVHLGSAIFSKKPFKKLNILIKAYIENIKNLEEIKRKREERKN